MLEMVAIKHTTFILIEQIYLFLLLLNAMKIYQILGEAPRSKIPFTQSKNIHVPRSGRHCGRRWCNLLTFTIIAASDEKIQVYSTFSVSKDTGI